MRKSRVSMFYGEMKSCQYDVDLEVSYLENAIQSIYQYIIANEKQEDINIIKENNEKIKEIIEYDILFNRKEKECKHDGKLTIESKDDCVYYVCDNCGEIVE